VRGVAAKRRQHQERRPQRDHEARHHGVITPADRPSVPEA
jgi:hypothetical protein